MKVAVISPAERIPFRGGAEMNIDAEGESAGLVSLSVPRAGSIEGEHVENRMKMLLDTQATSFTSLPVREHSRNKAMASPSDGRVYGMSRWPCCRFYHASLAEPSTMPGWISYVYSRCRKRNFAIPVDLTAWNLATQSVIRLSEL